MADRSIDVRIAVQNAGAAVLAKFENELGGIAKSAASSAGGLGTFEKALNGVSSAASKPAGLLSGLVDGFGKLGLAGLGLKTLATGIAGVATGMVEGNAEMQTYETQLGTLMGSSTKAKDRLAELAKFGAETPFELPEIVRAEKVLLGFGLTGEKVFQQTGKTGDQFRALVGDIAAGTGAQFEEIALNMGKFSSGATGEAISRFQEMGIATREQMRDMGIQFSKAGELLSPIPEAMQAVVKIANEKFGGGMEKLSKTFSGQMSTLSDNFGQIKNRIMAPVFEILTTGLGKLNDVLSSSMVQDTLEAIATALTKVVEGAVAFGGEAFHRLSTFFQSLAGMETLATAVNRAFGDLIPHELNTVLDMLDRGFLTLKDTLLLLADAARKALSGDFAGALQSALKAFDIFRTGVLANLESVVALIAPIVAKWANTLVEWIAPVLPKVLPALQALGQEILKRIEALVPPLLATLTKWGEQFVAWIAPAIPPMLAALGRLRDQFLDWIEAVAPGVLASFLAWKDAFIKWVMPATTEFLAQWPGFLNKFLDWVETAAGPLLLQLAQWALAFVKWVVPLIPPMLVALAGVAAAISIFIIETLGVIGERLLKWALAFVTWVGEKVLPQLPGELAKIATAIAEWAASQAVEIGKQALALGNSLIDGLAAAINEGVQRVVAAARQMVADAIAAAWAVVKPGSPSRETTAMGESMVEGLVTSIERGELPVASAAAQLAFAAIDAMARSFRASAGAPSAAVEDIVARLHAVGQHLTDGFRQIAENAGREIANVGGNGKQITDDIEAFGRDFQAALTRVGNEAGHKLDEIRGRMNQRLQQAAIEATSQIAEAVANAQRTMDAALDAFNASRDLRGRRQEFGGRQEAAATAFGEQQAAAELAYRREQELARAATEQQRATIRARHTLEDQDLAFRKQQTLEAETFRKQQAAERQTFEDAIEVETLRKRMQSIAEERDARIAGIQTALAAKQAAIVKDYEEERAKILENLKQRVEDLKTQYLEKVMESLKSVGDDLVEFKTRVTATIAGLVNQSVGDIRRLLDELGKLPATGGGTMRDVVRPPGGFIDIADAPGGLLNRAYGGDVRPGFTYKVGERGVEYLTMGSRGTVAAAPPINVEAAVFFDSEQLANPIVRVNDYNRVRGRTQIRR